jgi:hypothetical protein
MEALGEVPHPAKASARMLGRKEHAHTASQRGECVLCKRKVPLPGHLGIFYFIAQIYFPLIHEICTKVDDCSSGRDLFTYLFVY